MMSLPSTWVALIGLVACSGARPTTPTEPRVAPAAATEGEVLGVAWRLEAQDGQAALRLGDRLVPIQRDADGCYVTDALHGCWPDPAAIAEQLLRFSPDHSPLARPCLEPRYRLELERAVTPIGEAPPLTQDRVRAVFSGDLDGDGDQDAIVDLGFCSSWGDCLFGVFLRCAEPDVYALASPPNHYAQSLDAVPRADGPPELWESIRGEMEAANTITRVRWELRDGRAGPQ